MSFILLVPGGSAGAVRSSNDGPSLSVGVTVHEASDSKRRDLSKEKGISDNRLFDNVCKKEQKPGDDMEELFVSYRELCF